MTAYTEFFDAIMDEKIVTKKQHQKVHKLTLEFIESHFLMLRKGWIYRFKMLRFMRKQQPNKRSSRFYALGKTLKLAKQAFKYFKILEKTLLVEAKRSSKQ